ncbi:VOC family protein [Saliphagus sp. GCM10025308]
MPQSTLFHLHFNTPSVGEAESRLERAGLPLNQRFGSVRGEGVSLGPTDEIPEGFRFKLQVHQRGGVNVTLAPGRRPHFDHLGLIVPDFEAALERAESRGWSVRRNERRTFVMTPWEFRVEVHPPDGEGVAELGDVSECRLEETVLRLLEADAARAALADVFGDIPALRIEPGESTWVETFVLATSRTSRKVAADELLGA